jgi:Family of unknown function (DUF6600)
MMMRKSEVLVAFFAAAVCALAQDPDPPSRVARLNYLSGPVSFRPGTVDEWAAATVNYPLTIGDHLWADPGARTEMHIGSTAIRMASQTALSFLNLDDRAVQLSVTQGSVNVRIRELADDESYEIDTPNAAITILRAGSYRVDADGERNTTTVTVIAGDASVTGDGQAFPVHARQSARISGIDELSYQVSAPPPPDEFDDWCDQRDRAEDQVQSARYVPTEMTGYEDLDRYGTWRDEPDYGWVWGPSVVEAGWAPYRYGRWCWVEPWGWTWVDDAPWGFAPFHYGRWAYIAGGWVWVPGPRMSGIRPVYAPALVVFVGGPRFGGSAVWFPLGPREAFRPGYRASDRYFRNVNGTYNVADGRYANRGVFGAVTAVRESDFASGRHVLRISTSVDAREVARAPVAGFTAPIQPRRESVLPGPVREGPRFTERAVVVRRQPPVQRARFDGGAPPRAPMVRIAPPVRQASPRIMDSQPAFHDDRPRRVQEAPQMQPQPQTRPAAQPRRFDQPQRVEQPRPVEPARRAEPQRVQQPAPAVRRQEKDQPRGERRSERKEEKKQ